MEKLAKENDCDLAEIQRAAFSLFLRENDTKSTDQDTNSIEKECCA